MHLMIQLNVFFAGFTCVCDEDYMIGLADVCDRENCDDGDTFCLNGGYCTDGDTTSFCVCPPGITGTNCETGKVLYIDISQISYYV